MHIPEWFKPRRREAPPPPPAFPEIIGPPLESIPPHHQNLVSRVNWGAEPPYRPKPHLQHPVKWLRFSFGTDCRRCLTLVDCLRTVKDLQLQHINIAGIDDIQYNFLIGGDGKVYEGRGWHFVPENIVDMYKPWQNKFLDIAFIGDEKCYRLPPSQAMFKAAWQLIQYGVEHKYVSKFYKVL